MKHQVKLVSVLVGLLGILSCNGEKEAASLETHIDADPADEAVWHPQVTVDAASRLHTDRWAASD